MKSTQFCYWLQGSFELNESKEFNASQTKIIKDHLALVLEHDTKPNSFCSFLNGYFKMSAPEMINAGNTTLIQEELRKTFLNEIDPTYPERHELSRIHTDNINSRFEAMC